MNQARTVFKVRRTALRRLKRLEDAVRSAAMSPVAERKRAAAYVSIELANTWSQFVRAFIITCLLNARSSGGRITSNISVTTVKDALKAVRRVLSVDPWKEPAWHDTSTLTKVATQLSLSNAGQILAGISIGTSTLGDVPVYRNFFAHRSRLAATRVSNVARRFGILGSVHPVDVLLTTAGSRPQAIILDFCADIYNIVDLLTA
jgi:hypothetical protein